ncbi:MAG: amidohydrolase family protein [Planctomycetes bacterium]|nr:amidohydrolase family protein [Planctomycetota bacterium]
MFLNRDFFMLAFAKLALALGLAFAQSESNAAASTQDSKPASSRAASSKPAAPETQSNEESFLAIVNADVETVTAGRLRGATILVKGTKIWKVGRNITIPDSARRIDATGLRIYPGLVAARASGVGVSGFGAGGRNADRYNPFTLEVLGAMAAGLTTVCQGDTVMKLKLKGVDDILVRENAFLRLQYNSAQERFDLRDKLARAQAYLMDVREFEAKKAANDPSAKEPKKEGVDDNLLRLLRREVPARFEVDNASGMLPILALLDEYRFDCVFSGGLEAWTVANDLSRRSVRVIMSPRRRELADPRRNAPNGSSPEAAAILRRAGVEFALYPPPGFDGGDSVIFDGIAGRDLQTLGMDAAWATRGGLDDQTALESITISPARILGVDQRVGSIEPGKDADLILTDGNLLDYRTFVQMSIVNGTVQYEKAKAGLFQHIRPLQSPPTEVPARPAKQESK